MLNVSLRNYERAKKRRQERFPEKKNISKRMRNRMEANVLYQNNEYSETMNTIKQMFYTKTLEDNPVTPDGKLLQ